MMRVHRVVTATVLAVIGLGVTRAGAIEWIDGSIADGLRAAQLQKRPLLVWVHYNSPDPTVAAKTAAQKTSAAVEAAFFNSAAYAPFEPQFAAMRVNFVVNETVFDRYGVDRVVPAMLVLDQDTGKLAARIAGFPDQPEILASFCAERLTKASEVLRLSKVPGGPQTAADRLRLGDLYADLGTLEQAGAAYEAALEAGLMDDDAHRAGVVAAFARLMSKQPEDAMRLLNGALRGVRVRPWDEQCAPLWWPGEAAFAPLVLEDTRGKWLGALYRTRSLRDFVAAVSGAERIAAQTGAAAQLSGPEALALGNDHFVLEDAAGAIPCYERAVTAGGLSAADEEIARARVGLCRAQAGDKAGAMRDMDQFLAMYNRPKARLGLDEAHHRPQIMVTRAGLYFDAGNYRAAEALLDQVVKDYTDTDCEYWAAQARVLLTHVKQWQELQRRGGAR
ncbi:MAG TPA: tetratricopeptide repeat protein [Armatimonadota bacterium]|nr:tetratricopeptide repeat protein [Armatimonadota bacterium]HQK92678.1 tetratricopeptide repeat protein [Armatimonadota bacterium]